MTKDEAAEAGVLVEALDDATDVGVELEEFIAEHPGEFVGLGLSKFHTEGGAEHIGSRVIMPAWAAQLIWPIVVGVIQQRLAALGVDTSEPEAEEG